jgi:glycosyltransferase involved in cell wall biosynthesis
MTPDSAAGSVTAARTALIVNPSPDVYGADLQMLQTVSALVEAGWRVVVALPEGGPLVPRIHEHGADVAFLAFPVLRKGNGIRGLVTMLARAAGSLPRSVRLIRGLRASVLIVNTVTLPWWLLAGRASRTPTIGHLHEAETQVRRIVRKVLVAPLLLADAVIVISKSTYQTMAEVQPRLASRAHLIYNGVPQPPEEPTDAARTRPFRLAVVGRLSPRKAPDVAIEALAALCADGYDVSLEVAGSTFPGYEWYEEELRERAARPDLAGRVTFSGYASPLWPVLERADAVLAPSLHEPFGNAVVEAQLSARPVVAAASQGHLESVVEGQTGLLVEPGNAAAMAAATARLIEEAQLARALAVDGRSEAIRRFSVERYRSEVVALVEAVAH